MGFYSYSFSFFYPKNIEKDYEFRFNDKIGSTGIISRNTPEGILEVYEKSSGQTVYNQQISLAEISNIQFIKLGDNILQYIPEKFITFTPTIIYSGSAAQYSAWFNNQKLQVGELNYLSIDNLRGNFEIRKVGETTPSFLTEMTIEAGAVINLMQISDVDFIEFPEDIEPEPTEVNKCKVRFYYPDEVFDADEIKIDLYSFDEYIWDWVEPLELESSVTVKKGEISDYVELSYITDGSGMTSYLYSITNTTTGDKFVDYMTDMVYMGVPEMPCGDGVDVVFKKVTYQIMKNNSFQVLEGLTKRRK